MKIKNYQRFLDDDFDAVVSERIRSKTGHPHAEDRPTPAGMSQSEKNMDFRCVQCKASVSTAHVVCGVNNRNHCPHCLWSKHVDLYKPGDRLAECRSRMQPIGLTIKHTFKKYHGEEQGELMLIHRCTGCGKLSINRIAADDDPYLIYRTFQAAFEMDATGLNAIKNEGILPLGSSDSPTVLARLFGWQATTEEIVGLGGSTTGI